MSNLITALTAAAAVIAAAASLLRQLRHERTYHPPVMAGTSPPFLMPAPRDVGQAGQLLGLDELGEPKWIDPPR